ASMGPTSRDASAVQPGTSLHDRASLLHLSRADRALHSFPTRRSSDLRRSTSRPVSSCSKKSNRWSPPLRSSPSARRSPAVTTARSEEHTSELQSQSNIVCRLLLEKKKAYP